MLEYSCINLKSCLTFELELHHHLVDIARTTCCTFLWPSQHQAGCRDIVPTPLAQKHLITGSEASNYRNKISQRKRGGGKAKWLAVQQ